MKLLKHLSIVAILALSAGCASTAQSPQSLAASAGFKVITPNTPAQQTELASLPVGTASSIKHNGGTYYVVPDVKNNQAYIGTPAQYKIYQSMLQQQNATTASLETAESETSSLSSNLWGGWGGIDGIANAEEAGIQTLDQSN